VWGNEGGHKNVADAVTFQKGDAAHLDYADGTFDAAVSNFVFHEVRSQPDKTALIKEALRVIKPGGVFSLSDVYYSKGVYKDLDAMLQELSSQVAEIHFVDTRKNDFTPKILRTPMIIGDMGLIYGRK
jgi:ubiquinone/menaquinone biosynthesis C-methylase UbiE